jgi:hypothetical protein
MITPASATGLSLPEAPTAPAFPPQRADVMRRVTVDWHATVTSGPGLAAGSACTLGAVFDRTGTGSLRAYLDLECGSTTVYRPVDMGVRRVERDCQVSEQSPAEGEASRLALLCDGSRSGSEPLRIWVDTVRGIARVQDFEHQQTFEFHIEPFSTQTVRAPALTLACRPPVSRNGRVSESTPSAPMAPGTNCTVSTATCDGASPGVPHCRAEVRCGNRVVLYGGGAMGRVACEESGPPQRALDNDASPIDGDPRLELDLPSGRVAVSDTTPEERWSVTIRLEGAPGAEPVAH